MAGLELLLQARHPLHDFFRLGLEAIPQGLHHRVALIEIGEHRRAGHRLDAADSGGHTALAHNFEQADLGGVGHVGATAELHRHPGYIHHPHHLGVFLAEHGQGAGGLGLLDRHLPHLQVVGIGDPAVDAGLQPLQFGGRDRPGAVEVEAQPIEIHQGAGLGDGGIHQLFQGGLEQVGGGVVGLGAAAAATVHLGSHQIAHRQGAPLHLAAMHEHAAVAAHRFDLDEQFALG